MLNPMKLAAITLLLLTPTAFPQERGNWRAASKTAYSITGDLALAPEKLTIDFNTYPIAQIRTLTAPEAAATFDTPGAIANLYRLNIPGAKKFLHKNTLCGSEDVQWLVTSVSGKTLQTAFFSGDKIPDLTPEAMATATNLCGTFTYTR